MNPLPTGTVTLLFSDIEGSTQLLHRLGEGYAAVLAEHQRLLREAFAAHGGREIDTQGDAFFIVFERAADAVAGAAAAQRALASHPWPEGGKVCVRMGLHTGEPARSETGYVGLELHQGARIMAAGHGGQTLLSQTTHDLAQTHLSDGVSLRDLGEHRLKDLAQPEHLWQLVIAGLPSDFPPVKTLGYRPNNLPGQLTPLIGRVREAAEICALLRRDPTEGEVRLLTLSGPGGAGKTRLALQAASDLLGDFEDGVFFVPLAPIGESPLVASTVAGALGLKEIAGQAPSATVEEYLRAKHLLLVMDNFEQVVGAASWVVEMLSSCPHLRVLVTSRIVLRVRGEHEFAVPPLSLPGRRPPPPPDVMSQFSAVALFIERAQSVKPDFDVTIENAPAIAEICFRLDGLPLAIELAAARIKMLPPQAMLPRLESRFNLLKGGSRDLPARQQTLHAAIGWSYDLLDSDEQSLFRRLSVFVGDFSLEAGEAVGGGSLDVLNGMASLMDKSLLWQRESEGEARFFMLESIRQFGLERLADSGEEAVLRGQHADFFLALALAAHPRLLGTSEQPVWIERLERDQDNLRAALSWLMETTPSEGLRLAMLVARFWRVCGRDTELRETLERALERDGDAPADVRVIALREMGEVLQRTNDWDQYPRARQLLEESAAISREAGDLKNLGWTLRCLCEGARASGDYERARLLSEESLAIERQRGDKRSLGYALHYAGSVARDQDDLDTARALYEESAALLSKIDGAYGVARPFVHLAAIAYLQHDIAAARGYWEKSLPIFREIKDKLNLTWALRWLSSLALTARDAEGARVLSEEYLALSRELDDGEGQMRATWALAEAAHQEGRHEAAHALLQQVAPWVRESGSKQRLRDLLEWMAQVAAAREQWERAAQLFGAVESLSEAGGIALPHHRAAHDPRVRATSQALGDEAFLAAWARGRAMTFDEAATYALEESGAVADAQRR